PFAPGPGGADRKGCDAGPGLVDPKRFGLRWAWVIRPGPFENGQRREIACLAQIEAGHIGDVSHDTLLKKGEKVTTMHAHCVALTAEQRLHRVAESRMDVGVGKDGVNGVLEAA